MTLLPFALCLSLAAQAPAVQIPEDATYYFLLARYLEGGGKIDQAVDALKKAIALDPRSAEPRAELAGLYARQDKAPEALTAAEDALKVDPTNQEANRVLGSVLAALAEQRQAARPGDEVAAYPKRAMAALEIARGDGTGDLSIDLALGRLYLDADRPTDAIPLLRRIVLEQPQYAEGSVMLADAQEAAGAPDAAVETLTNLLDDQPQFVRGRVQLAELYEHQRRWPQAAGAWGRVQTLNPRNTEVAARRASALINARRPAEARDVLTAALKMTPNDVRMSFMLAQAQRDAGDLDAAEATARALQAAQPDDARVTSLLGQMLEARGRYQEVVDLLKPEIARQKTAKAKGGQIAMLLGSEGLAFQQLHRYDEAVAAFKEGAALSPEEPVRYVLLIQGYRAAGRHQDALDEAEKARLKFPADTTVLYQLGAALDRAGRQAESERTFRDVIARDPLDAGALNYLGYMLADHGNALNEAETLIRRALTIEPDNPSFLDSLGWTYVQQGRLDLADPPLSTAAQQMPKSSVIQDHLGDLRQKQNRRADAISAWQKALTGDGAAIERATIQKKIDLARKAK
ncbi:MAG TPA: tetratricopeptide repeat protein [Vicinamibacterales bacterium]